MKKTNLYFKVITLFLGLTLLVSSCSKEQEQVVPETKITNQLKSTLSENFETGSKSSYAAASVTLSTGSWYFDDALIGNLSTDRKNGSQSARIRNVGKLTMQFDKTSGAGTVTVKHAIFSSDGSSTWELWMSTNSGSSWTKVGSTVSTSSTTLTSQSFTVNQDGNVRFDIRKISGGTNRINIDDVSITDYSSGGGGGSVPGDNDNLLLGNPSNATYDLVNANNYLMVKPQYCLSYSNSKHTPNWTSWHVTSTDLGSAARQDDFRPDATLPVGWYQVVASEFSGSGFDRGHMCPSADRTSSVANNSATFLMTNMIPQSPNNNQVTWANLENYTRTLVNAGNEVYTISGPYGQGGTGSNGYATTVGNGVVVPAQTWKIIVVLPNGNNDLSRITTSTRVIAVLMPNNQTVSSQAWGYYRVSVDQIEALTGYDFLSNVPASIQSVIEAKVDNGPVQ
jgi:endonuclease G